ncbi:MAG: uroporphyrinogen-III synthase [Psittacicella sp.]
MEKYKIICLSSSFPNQDILNTFANCEILIKNIYKITPGDDLSLLRNLFNSLTKDDYVLSVSKNASFYVNQALKAWNISANYLTPGKKSALFLKNLIKKDVLFPKKETALEALRLVDIEKANRIVILSSEYINKELLEFSKKNLIELSFINTYKRELSLKPTNIEVWKNYGYNSIIVLASSYLETLLKLSNQKTLKWVLSLKIFVYNEKVKLKALELGFKDVEILNR